jgi:hypothetical protein
MNKKRKSFINYTIYSLYALIWAGVYGVVTYFVLFRWVAGENMMLAYILNILFILLGLITDKKMLDYIKKKSAITEKNTRSILHHLLFTKYDLVSLKSSLYMFHIFTMIATRALAFNTSIEVSESIQNYLHAMDYVLLLLVVFDIFIQQITSDDRQIKSLTEK